MDHSCMSFKRPLTWCQTGWMSRPQIMTNYSVPKTLHKAANELWAVCIVASSCWKNCSLSHLLNFYKVVQKILQCILIILLCPKRRGWGGGGPTIIFAVMVQHILTLMSCSGSSYINIRLSTVSVFMWPFK